MQRNFSDVQVKRTDQGTDVLLPKDTISELGWDGLLEKGPVVFGHGNDKCTIRQIQNQENQGQTART